MIVIGAGRIGTALKSLEPPELLLLDRDRSTDAWDAWAPAAIIVATRNDDLDQVVDRVPASRHEDLVFIQNGMLRSWLAERGLSGATRGILRFAVQIKGQAPVPGDDSLFCGPHASRVATWLQGHGIAAQAVDEATFARLEIEKLVWNSAFGLLCDRWDVTVGEIVQGHRQEFDELSAELLAVCSAALGVEMDIAATQGSMRAYSASIPNYRAAVKEWPWRNGWIVQAAQKLGLAIPLHDAYAKSRALAST